MAFHPMYPADFLRIAGDASGVTPVLAGRISDASISLPTGPVAASLTRTTTRGIHQGQQPRETARLAGYRVDWLYRNDLENPGHSKYELLVFRVGREF
jgi:hypothetical protein